MVVMNRPSVKNAMNDDMYEDLVSVMIAVEDDPTIAAMVLTGMGDYFSSGADLAQASQVANSLQPRQTLHKPAGKFMHTLLHFSKILAAAVQGPAVGIAMTLLLHCDLVIADRQRATFWAPFTRLALVPELCSSSTFPRTMGLSKANEMLLLGKRISAQTAYEYNICSQLHTIEKDSSRDPFGLDSLASKLSHELHASLLSSLPLGDKTANEYFVKLVKHNAHRKQQLQTALHDELRLLDERFDTGQVAQAFAQLSMGKSKRRPTHSRL